jgi:hypothetical protein
MPRRSVGGYRRVLCRVVLCAACVGVADAAPLDAKPGLWERTVVTMSELFPTGPKPDLSKIEPEERKKLEEVMSGRVTTGRRTRVTEECVTPAMLEKWSALARDPPGEACKRTIATENSKEIKVALSCDGGQTTGDIEYKASGERLEGKISMVSHEREFDRLVTHEITSKWLGRDCGTVGPLEPGPPVSRQLK